MIPQAEISRTAHREGMSDRVIEKDYVITWILLALADSELKYFLVFKGGTALKKIYFPDYRYSEDLDFTVVKEISSKEIIARFENVLDMLSKSQGFQFDIPEKEIEKREGSLTLYVYFVGPLQAGLGNRKVKVDFTLSEKLIFPVGKKVIHSAYSDATEKEITVYLLEEILTEKLCAIIDRTEPRDIYDANFLFSVGGLDYHQVKVAFREKAEFKEIDADRLSDVLKSREATIARMWDNRLQEQVKDLPHLKGVLREFKRSLRKYKVI